MSGFLAPFFGAGWQAFSAQGIPLPGGKLYTYAAGSVNTPQATYSDSSLSTALANPIILGSDGRPATEIWLSGVNYKFVLTDANDVELGSWDYVPGLNNVGSSVSEWTPSGLVPTYIDATSFSVPGNQTTLLPIDRRVQYFLGATPYYGYISNSVYDGSTLTTITIVPDVTNLNNTLSGLSYAFLNSVNPSVPQQLLAAVASQTHAAGTKATPADSDEMPLVDSAASYTLKKFTWANLKTAFLNTVNAFTKGQSGTPVALTSASASIAIDLSLANNFTHTTTEDTTLAAPSNPVAGQSGIIVITQDGTTPYTLAYNSFWKFAGGSAPSLTATAGAVDVLAYYVESATRATCNLLGDVK